MFELCQLAPRTYVIQAPSQIGIYLLDDRRALLIDSGSDKQYGKRILKILNENGWEPAAIFNTHSHADHIGGNAYIQEQTGCPAYAYGIEAAMSRRPMMEPTLLYGAYPPAPLRNKFMLAAESNVQDVSAFSLPQGAELLPMVGHYFDMAGFRTPDNVLFTADCFCSELTLEKYHLTYLYDAAAYRQTLCDAREWQADWFVPSHAAATRDIRPLIDRNIEKFDEITALLEALCAEPITMEELLRAVFRHYGMKMDFNQYVLIGTTMRAYLSMLADKGCIEARFEDDRLTWVHL